ncbi:MAG: sulfotransferase, partial [Desulfobulbaceae bacterium]|nr:sulfotransferase [Desulfobulbaceae bacterium]
KYKGTINQYKAGCRFVEIEFADLVTDPLCVVRRITDAFSLDIELTDELCDKIVNFIDPNLKHHNLKNLSLRDKVALLGYGKD